jgi:ABC-type branched-subunit amino acid transport system substrate-binding protein
MRKPLLVLAATVSLSLVVSAHAPVGAVTQAAQASTVKVGILTPIDSPGVSNPSDGDAIQAAVKYFNKRGGVGTQGAKLEAVVCDTHGDPNDEVECARQLVEEGVAATVGDLTFLNTAGVVEVLEPEGIPRIGLSAGDQAQFGSAVSYPVSAGPVGEFVAAAKGLADKGAETVAMVLTDTPTAGALAGLVTQPFAQAGLELVEEVRVPDGATDYSPFVSAVQSAGADAAIVALGEQPAAQFVAAMTQLNADFRLAGLTPSFSLETLRENEDVTKPAVFVNSLPYPSPNNVKNFPGLKNFFNAMKASKKEDLQPRNIVPSTLRVWMGVLGFVDATRNLDTIDAETVTQALETEQDLEMDRLIPAWTPSTPGYSVFAAISNHFVYLMRFNGRNLVTQKTPIDITQYFATS